jgi:hypothetical protein
MKLNEWRENVDYAIELAKILKNPVFVLAQSVLEEMTAAKVIGGTPQLYQLNNAHILFGYDAGRASILADLSQLAEVPEEQVNIQPTYTSEF